MMTPIAITFLGIALTVIWGGLIASAIFLSKRSEVAHYPEGGQDAPSVRLDP